MSGSSPSIEFGTTFSVKSRNSDYTCTLVRSCGNGHLIVRLLDRRLARLETKRIDWSTLIVIGRDPVARPGDDVTVVLPGEQVRGTLSEPIGAEVAVRTPSGRDQRFSLAALREILLPFRARDVLEGDRFVVRSRSGNYYRGVANSIAPDRTIHATLEGGARVTVQWGRLDPESLVVLVPLDLDGLRAMVS